MGLRKRLTHRKLPETYAPTKYKKKSYLVKYLTASFLVEGLCDPKLIAGRILMCKYEMCLLVTEEEGTDLAYPHFPLREKSTTPAL